MLLAATYDPVRDTTFIRGRIASDVDRTGLVTSNYVIELYESSSLSVWGYPQGERLLTTKTLVNGHSDFELTVPRDLRGKFLTATNTRLNGPPPFSRQLRAQSHEDYVLGDTSEFSNAIEVH